MGYRIELLEQRCGQWVPSPVDIEEVETLEEAREHAVYAPINIYGPGQCIGFDAPLEQIIDQYE
jgi:hypothetical protein